MPDISIIIVNYNVKEFLLNSLESVFKAAQGLEIEVIVVDNASEDGSVEALQKNYPKVILIRNEENLGFGKANNIGLKKANGKYILLLNPDTIVREDTFVKMIAFFESHRDAGMAGCKVLNPDGTLQLACRRSFPGPWTSFTKVAGLSSLFPKSKLFAKYNLTYLDENQTYEVDSISGSFMMFRKEVYEKVGGFDDRFFMYGEDLDLCYRVRKAGYKVYYFHETEIIHYKGESTKRSSLDETKIFYDAMKLFVKKHFSSSFLIEFILKFAISIRQGLAFLNLYKMPILSAVADAFLFAFSLLIAENIYRNQHWLGFPESVKPWIYIVPAILQVFVSALFGAYKKSLLSVARSLASLIFGVIVLSSITFFLKQYGYSRAVILITYSLAIIFFSLWRIVAKLFFKIGISVEDRAGNTIVVGTGETALNLAKKLKANFTDVYYVVGLIGKTFREVGTKKEGFEVLGSIKNINKIIKERKIRKVIFSSEEVTFNEMFNIVASLQNENISFLFSGARLDYLVGKSSVTMLDDIPLLKVNYNISSLLHRTLKRSLDLVLSALILLLFYTFIYLISRVKTKRSEFERFVLSVPDVFLGKKSFVGPRKSSYYNSLYIGKLGLTGYWYTEIYDRNDSREEDKLNIYYARNQNIWLDLEILGKTFSKMFIKSEK
jgi:GT2 family glycosyltransferase